MSTTEAPPAETTKETEKKEEETNENTNNNKPIKKVKSKKDIKNDLKNDPSRFDTPGVNFNAKLIGIDDVESARGDKMCQESMYRLKIAVKQSGQHKPKIIVNVSLDGIRIIDLKTHAVNHTHPVHRISFISRDITDHRAFGYVFGAGEGKHKFFAIKTEKAAEALVLTLRDLFQVVYELKKKEVEDAKHKIEEPTGETATEAKEGTEEPVYQVPTNGKPVENESDPTYQVPNNNKPVETEAPDLLQMETELQTIERRIEQIDTMEELFKELEAPPTTTQATPIASSGVWSSDLAGLSHTQTQPAFSIGGAPFSASQPFPPPNSNPFPMGPQPGPFGPGAQQFGAQPGFTMQGGFPPQQQMPGVQPFQPPTVPPRNSGFPGQPAPFPGAQFPPQQQPGFMSTGQQPVRPGMPGAPQPAINVIPANDPFGVDPFSAGGNAFEEGVLTPAVLATSEAEQPKKPAQTDIFGDLVSIEGAANKPALSPKEMFVDLATPSKKSLNELKVDKSPSPKPPSSPVGFQASEESETLSTEAFQPFTTSDPFANDPFSSTGPAQNISHNQPDAFGTFSDDDDFTPPLPQGPPPPLPKGPPPPLPDDIPSQPPYGPIPPPRPDPFPQDMPPVPPRPMSTSSEGKNSSGSLSSLNESQQMTPPVPARPENRIVPRPRPRPSKTNNTPTLSKPQTNTQITEQKVPFRAPVLDLNKETTRTDFGKFNSSSERISNSGISDNENISKKSVNNDSNSDSDSISSLTKTRTSSVVVDPFVSTDPFASDPFTQADPFANDPFNPDPFSESCDTQPVSNDDPFRTVVTHKPEQTSDPFSVFDNTLSGDSFKFEKSSSRKNKTKVQVNDPFGMQGAFK